MAALYPPRVFLGCRIVFFGDSRVFIDWQGTANQPGQLKALIEAQWRIPSHATYGKPPVSSGIVAVAQPGSILSVQPASYPTVTMFNRGVSGSRIADLDGTVAAALTATNPDLSIILMNTNDINGIVGPATDPAVFVTSFQSVINKHKAFRPTLPIVILSDFTYGENYLTGPDRINSFAPIPANVPALWSLNPQCKTVADANPDVCTYADICTPYLAWLIANFVPPGPSTGAATSDGLHQNTAGAQLISRSVLPYLAIDP